MLQCFSTKDYLMLNQLLGERQQIIDIFEKNPEIYNKNNIVMEIKKTNIMELDVKVKELIVKNMGDINKKLHSLENEMKIKRMYHVGFSGNPLLLNKKIY
jgi:hypothetical protein